MSRSLSGLTLAVAFMTTTALPAKAVDPGEFDTTINLLVEPFGVLELLDPALLALTIPPPGSTVPSLGVRFRVTGNAAAIMTAEPDDFMEVPSEGFVGKAILGAGSVGYKLELRFPRTGVPGSPVQIAVLPGFEPAATPPLEVNLTLTGGVREGVVHMETSPDWTETGALPLPGVYVGEVILTLTADTL